MKRTALIIAYYFPPLGMGGVQRMAKLAKYLPRFGYDVKVLTIKPIRFPAHDKSLLDEFPDSVAIYRSGSRDPARVARFIPFPVNPTRRLKSMAKGKAGFWPDAKIGWKKPAVKLGKKIIEQGGIDVIISSSPPITGHLVAIELADHFDLPWVADYRDIWESRPPEELYGDKSLVKRSHLMLTEIAEKADAVTAINNTIVSRISEDGIVISGGFDPQDFEGQARKPGRDKFILCYLGTVGSLHPIEPFFRATRIARESDSEFAGQVEFCIIGANDERAITRAAKDEGLDDRVNFTGYLPHKISLEKAAQADVSLLSVPAGYIDVMTGKIFDLLALEPPILASVPIPGEAEQLINRYQGGICVAPGHTDLLADKMLLLYRNRCDGIKWKKRDMSDFTRPEVARIFAELFDRIIRERS